MMLRSIYTRLAAGLLLIISLACTSEKRAEEVVVKFIETTDVHGAIFPYDFIYDRESTNSLAQVCTYVTRERGIGNQEVILLDNGDILQGQPVVYLSNYIDTNATHICAEVMNYLGYDAGTIGNHDIEAGHAVYDKLVEEFNFPWLAANALEQATGKPYFLPYTILERQGIQIAILGLVTPRIPDWLPPEKYEGMEFEDMITSARYWVDKIQKEVDPDILVGLFHAGHDFTYSGNNPDTPKNENASILVAEKVPGFDMIFIGHDHDMLIDSVINQNGEKVYIVDPGSHAGNTGAITIRLSYDRKNHTYAKKIHCELVNVAEYPPDPGFMDRFEPWFKKTKEFVDRYVTEFTATVSSQDALFGNSAFVDLIHSIQLDLTVAEISFTAPLSFNTRIMKGKILVRDLFKLYRFENFLYTMSLTGREIRDYLEYSYANWFSQMKDDRDHLLLFELDKNGEIIRTGRDRVAQLKGRYYNFDSAAGIKYSVDVSKPPGDRVLIYSLTDGTPFSPDKTYSVAINSYRGNGGGGHLVSGADIPKEELQDRVIRSSKKDLRFLMMSWMKNRQTLEPEKSSNWKIIPEEWWEKGMQKDKMILFPEE